MSKVTVIDYGASNLLNVVRALEHCGAQVEVTNAPEVILSSMKLVFPGVGAFGQCMDGLRGRGLVQPIKNYVDSGRPFLGICVGMQVMFETGEEFGHHQGLGIVQGTVSKIPNTGKDGRPHKIPHIGWSELLPARDWNGTIFASLSGRTTKNYAYFVHSYHGHPTNRDDMLATVDYNGVEICAAIQRGNVYGCQFHPEKSGGLGLSILQKFLSAKL